MVEDLIWIICAFAAVFLSLVIKNQFVACLIFLVLAVGAIYFNRKRKKGKNE